MACFMLQYQLQTSVEAFCYKAHHYVQLSVPVCTIIYHANVI